MKEKIEILSKKADENLESSVLLIDNEFYDIAVSSSYYAMFYAAEAILLKFGLNFVKQGIFQPRFGRDLNRALTIGRQLITVSTQKSLRKWQKKPLNEQKISS